MENEPATHILRIHGEEFKRIEGKRRSFLVQKGLTDVSQFNIGDILYLDEHIDGKRTGARVVATLTDCQPIGIGQEGDGLTAVFGISIERT